MHQPAAQVLTLADAAQTRRVANQLGEEIAKHPELSLVITLSGELGAGKTTFVGGLLAALGHAGSVRSPTYTLIEPYEFGERRVYHLDLYRLATPSEVEGLAIRDLLEPGSVLLIEWPEKGEGALPSADLMLQLEYLDAGRRLTVHPRSPIGVELTFALFS
jgi:tRNA threonylcarbamoyladenosine biosynthesis protein TsaE